MHQARLCVHTNVRLHAKVPLVALLDPVHFGVTPPELFLVELGAAIKVASTTVPLLGYR